MQRMIIIIAALLAGSGVAMGAWTAHGLSAIYDHETISTLKTAVHYQLWQSLAGLVVVALMAHLSRSLAITSVWLMLAGVVAFSGSIYGLSLLNWRWLWPVTPMGGVLMIVGWAVFLVSAWRGK